MRCTPERLTALAGANFCRGDRRQRRNDTDAEHHPRLKEIEAECAERRALAATAGRA